MPSIQRHNKYKDKTQIYTQAAEKYGTNLFPNAPICNEYLLFIKQLLTMDEAAVVRHLNSYPEGKTAKMIAEAENRPIGEVQAILEDLSNKKRVIMSFGPKHNKRYAV